MSSTDLGTLATQLEAATVIIPASTNAEGSAAAPERFTDAKLACEILSKLLTIDVTQETLRTTRVGLIVGKLKAVADEPNVAKLAKDVKNRWKSQVIPPATSPSPPAPSPTPSASSAAAPAKAKSTTASASPPVPAVKKKDDSESESKKRSAKDESEERERDKKKQKLSKSKSSSSDSLADQFPELTAGEYGLFQTENRVRDQMQYAFYKVIEDPPAIVAETIKKRKAAVAAARDLSAYKASTKHAGTSFTAAGSTSTFHAAGVNTTEPASASTADGTTKPATSDSDVVMEGEKKTSTTVAPSTSSPIIAPVPAPVALPSFPSRCQLAHQIEHEMHERYGDSNDPYRQRYRDLAPQLKQNEELRISLYLCQMTPKELVFASLSQLAPTALKAKREKEAAYNREAARSDIGGAQAGTDQFPCEVCKTSNCTFFQQQTRGADEPMTIFLTCLTCGNKWKEN